jgi:putative two-component system response regulator
MFTLLVVEDHDGNRKLFCDLLQSCFRIVEARSAEEALVQLATSTPDLILLDYHLPGMDGLSLLRHLKTAAATVAVPVVIVSAAAQSVDRERARALGCVEFIAKPITDGAGAFIERLLRHLPRRTVPQGPRCDSMLRKEKSAHSATIS